jgi:hypothetical protein
MADTVEIDFIKNQKPTDGQVFVLWFLNVN